MLVEDSSDELMQIGQQLLSAIRAAGKHSING